MMLSTVCLSDVWRLSVAYIGPKSRTERPMKTKHGTEVAYSPRHTWLGHHFQGQKVKGQGHQAALLTAALTRQAAAAVSVETYWAWEPTATLPSAGAVGSATRGASAPTEGGEGRGILWRPPAYSLFLFLFFFFFFFFFSRPIVNDRLLLASPLLWLSSP